MPTICSAFFLKARRSPFAADPLELNRRVPGDWGLAACGWADEDSVHERLRS